MKTTLGSFNEILAKMPVKTRLKFYSNIMKMREKVIDDKVMNGTITMIDYARWNQFIEQARYAINNINSDKHYVWYGRYGQRQ